MNCLPLQSKVWCPALVTREQHQQTLVRQQLEVLLLVHLSTVQYSTVQYSTVLLLTHLGPVILQHRVD